MARFGESVKNSVFWWSPPKRHFGLWRRENAGDYLSPVIVERLLQWSGSRIGEKRPDTRRLLAVGSIMHFARDGDVIWGSGVNGKVPGAKHQFTDLDVRAVRGPLTREFLLQRGIACPQVYGDPVLLLPTLFPELARRCTGTRAYAIVPHLHDVTGLKAAGIDTRQVILPTARWERFVNGILQSRFVLSGSLHGLIVAEAFGIPARLLRLSEREPLFKYQDYYLGTGRHAYSPTRSVAEGLAQGGEPLPVFDAQALLDAFPMDLWPVTASRRHARGTLEPQIKHYGNKRSLEYQARLH